MAGARPAGNSFDDANAALLELGHLVRIIGKQPHRLNAERLQRFGGEFIIARVVGEAEFAVRLHRVEPGVLQLIRLQFIDQPDSAAFLRQIEHEAGRFFGNLAQRKFKLGAAIAALRCENIAGQALRMYSHQRRLLVVAIRSARDFPVLNRHGFFARFSLNAENPEITETGRQRRARDDPDRAFLAGFDFSLHGILDYNRRAQAAMVDDSPPALREPILCCGDRRQCR